MTSSDEMKITFTHVDDDGFENAHELPAKYEVCPRCQGKGQHSNPSIDGHGITADEWNGPDWDDESRETYMSGGYDLPCDECQGQRVVLVVDEPRADPAVLKLYDEQQAAEAQYRRERAYELKMGY